MKISYQILILIDKIRRLTIQYVKNFDNLSDIFYNDGLTKTRKKG